MGSAIRRIARASMIEERKAQIAALRRAAHNGALLARAVAETVQAARHAKPDEPIAVVLDRALCSLERVMGLRWRGEVVTDPDGKWTDKDAEPAVVPQPEAPAAEPLIVQP